MSKVLTAPKKTSLNISTPCISYANDRFIAASSSGEKVYYSFDGETWQNSSMGEGGSALVFTVDTKACYCNGTYIIPCDSTSTGAGAAVYLYSPDGITWSQKATPENKAGHWLCASDGNKFILVAYASGTSGFFNIYSSTDGLAWTSLADKMGEITSGSIPNDIIYNNIDENFCILMQDSVKRYGGVLTLYCGNSGAWSNIEVNAGILSGLTDTKGHLLMAGENIIYYPDEKTFFYQVDASQYLTSKWSLGELSRLGESATLFGNKHMGWTQGILGVAYYLGGETTTYVQGYFVDGKGSQHTLSSESSGTFSTKVVAAGGNKILFGNSGGVYVSEIVEQVDITFRRSFNYQDIQSTDRESWTSFVSKMKSNDFTGAQTIAQSMTGKQLNAKQLNDLFTFLVENQNLSDPTFKSSKIATSPTVPTGLGIGQMYFKEYV